MKTPENSKRSRMIGTRYTPEEIAIITRIAKEHNITVSDLIYVLTTNTVHLYPHIGKDSPNEERLKNEIENLQKALRKLSIELENANTKLGIDKKRIVELEKDCLNQILELNQLSNEIKKKDEEIDALKKQGDGLMKVKNEEIEALKKQLNDVTKAKDEEIETLKKQPVELKKAENNNEKETFQIPDIGGLFLSSLTRFGEAFIYGGKKS